MAEQCMNEREHGIPDQLAYMLGMACLAHSREPVRARVPALVINKKILCPTIGAPRGTFNRHPFKITVGHVGPVRTQLGARACGFSLTTDGEHLIGAPAYKPDPEQPAQELPDVNGFTALVGLVSPELVAGEHPFRLMGVGEMTADITETAELPLNPAAATMLVGNILDVIRNDLEAPLTSFGLPE